MTKDFFSSDVPDLTAEACAWIAQLETGELTPEDLGAFREWIKRSPRHYAEIHRLARLSGAMNSLTDMAEPLRAAAERRRPIVKKAPAAGHPKWRIQAVAVACLLFVVSATVLMVKYNRYIVDTPYLIGTTVGGFRETPLPDGSVVKLNTDSQIEVDFDTKQRRVRLLKGEAFFEVAHNPSRPFIVYAGDKHIQAIGTAFAVRWTDNDLTVTVSEGRVEVESVPVLTPATAPSPAPPAAPKVSSTPPTVLGKGQRLALSNRTTGMVIEDMSARQLKRELSWRSGLLDFADAPLSDVVREMSRYTPIEIEIADDTLRDMRFGGLFRAGEIDAFFAALELSFGVTVERVSTTHVRLRRTAG